jgi:aspartate racemase
MRTLGLIGGMSWESTATYYRLLNEGAKQRLGGLHSAQLLLWSFDFAPIAEAQTAGDWDRLTAMMVDAAKRLERAGAEGIVIGANTMHKMADDIARSVAVPLIHVVDATAAAIKTTSSRNPALLATRYTMEQEFYRGRFSARHALALPVPDESGRAALHRIIFEELCRGIIRPESKAACLAEIAALRKQGADGVVLGCTELGMILSQADLDCPVFDTTAIHAAAALDFACA